LLSERLDRKAMKWHFVHPPRMYLRMHDPVRRFSHRYLRKIWITWQKSEICSQYLSYHHRITSGCMLEGPIPSKGNFVWVFK
jgi:hypothetical protein